MNSPKPAAPTVGLMIRIPPELGAWLRELAATTGMSQNALVIAALQAEREKGQKGTK